MTKLTKEMVKKAINDSGGIQSIVAQKCNVARSTISEFLNKPENKDIMNELIAEKEKVLDLAENKLIKLMKDGEFNAIKFYLTTQAKARGYVEKTETELTFTNPSFTLIIDEPNDKSRDSLDSDK